jgi:hypothetical protein
MDRFELPTLEQAMSELGGCLLSPLQALSDEVKFQKVWPSERGLHPRNS